MIVDELYVLLREIHKIRILAANLQQQITSTLPNSAELISLQGEIKQELDSIIDDYAKYNP